MMNLPVVLTASLAATCTALSTNTPNNHNQISSRRSWLAKGFVSASSSAATLSLLGGVAVANPPAAIAEIDALPSDLRKFTALAPLGDATSTGNKLNGLSLDEIAARLSRDLVDGSTGKGGYFISGTYTNIHTIGLYSRYVCFRLIVTELIVIWCLGDISTEIFRDDCEFTDPTNSVSSLSKYQKALTILFNPEQSFVKLVQPLVVDDQNREIMARIQSGGTLQLPWNPRISSYER